MNQNRATCLLIAAAIAASAGASTADKNETIVGKDLVVNYAPPVQSPVVAAAAIVFAKPKVGLRVGGGQWNEFVANAGIDVTFAVPFLPIPALRVDAEVWGKPSNFGKDRRGNAVSLLIIQNIVLGYVGVGPSYYFADDNGNHKSGIGAKLLGGINLPKGFFVEGGVLVGPSPTPAFITLGTRF